MNYNKILYAGRLTRDPELRYTASGQPICEISVASNSKAKDATEEKTCFINCVVWDKQAELTSKLPKGSPVFIEGSLLFEEWEKNGEKRRGHKINVSRIQFLTKADK